MNFQLLYNFGKLRDYLKNILPNRLINIYLSFSYLQNSIAQIIITFLRPIREICFSQEYSKRYWKKGIDFSYSQILQTDLCGTSRIYFGKDIIGLQV